MQESVLRTWARETDSDPDEPTWAAGAVTRSSAIAPRRRKRERPSAMSAVVLAANPAYAAAYAVYTRGKDWRRAEATEQQAEQVGQRWLKSAFFPHEAEAWLTIHPTIVPEIAAQLRDAGLSPQHAECDLPPGMSIVHQVASGYLSAAEAMSELRDIRRRAASDADGRRLR